MGWLDLFLLPARALHFVASFILFAFALHAYARLFVLWRPRRAAARERRATGQLGRRLLRASGEWPTVTTQLPIYNEANVAARLIETAAAMVYPPGRHRLQVLDDSTDETRAIVDRCAVRLRAEGVRIEVLRREDRAGFKAGALAAGLARNNDELLAVFDADFIPPRDFLLRTVPHFSADPQLGFVQGRWTFLNEHASALCGAQAGGLDSHFAIEQGARSAHPDLFMTFNGTAGLWRRAAIDAAGGWSAETLTEDFDLSYRAQLAGWHGQFLPRVAVPGELPATFSAFKCQQFRWAKGSIQTALRIWPRVWRAPHPVTTKVAAFFHLTHYAVHPLVLLVLLLGPWVTRGDGAAAQLTWAGGVLLGVAALAPVIFYSAGQARFHPRDWHWRLLRLPMLTIAGLGLAVNNSRAVIEALLGRRSPFVRTPKQGDAGRPRYRVHFPVPPWIELVLALYSLAAAAFALADGNWGAAYFATLCTVALACLGIGSLREGAAAQDFKAQKISGAGNNLPMPPLQPAHED